ncbi:inositol-3-phosphate synthase [Candidatus Bathyarchaeota archaeon]|nr:inositol-3-phosphate synthase [Candidatus Bathyarchaeota archaeon]NIU81483.1 inositol-3-phosphate synthase [Candidatus Bathyarchaeota archaeon]NIV67527.1 inositol-3-phosphate synthase [Candidatus Bathyarchaeota archaeon]NIW16508.1 inositol-3-phosphate synthase [Candidatus Bathyarchaeota archaeon]NIW34157.1 inositol-3-phosphate synthase [Candidatus Bathyarchaeota archaeon]
MSKIRVALVGVGNCASALIQGVHYYKEVDEEEEAVGLRNLFLGGYHPRDIEFVSAFDIDARKIGKDLSEAMVSKPNNTRKFASVPHLAVPVLRGPVLDGVGQYLKGVIQIHDSEEVDVAKALRDSHAEMVVDLLPSGARRASRRYAEEALEAGCAFLNATPAIIASDADWGRRFKEAGVPLVGDDLVDQVGATILHKILLKTLAARGVRVSETYQLDVGGGTESLDTLERSREVKRSLKTRSVRSVLPYEASVVAGSTDYVDFLENRRDSYFWIKGLYFGKTPMRLDLRLCTVDAPNAVSVMLDVVRAIKLALDRGIAGPLRSISAYAFKNPPQKLPLEEAERIFEDFLVDE